jgi:hypothetical protein
VEFAPAICLNNSDRFLGWLHSRYRALVVVLLHFKRTAHQTKVNALLVLVASFSLLILRIATSGPRSLVLLLSHHYLLSRCFIYAVLLDGPDGAGSSLLRV